MMRIRRYVGDTIQEAVAQARAELGKDAVILQTRRIAGKGFWGLLGRRRVELIVALDAGRQRYTPPERRPTPGPAGVAESPNTVHRGTAAVAPHLEGAAEREDRSVAAVLAARREQRPVQSNSEVTRLRDKLVHRGLPPQEAEVFSREVGATAPIFQSKDGEETLSSAARDALVGLLSDRISTVDPWELEDGPYFAALVGPTGVGKTTTVAKLAANYVLASSKKVALIASDTYRIGAVEQLREYANLIGIPLEVVNDEAELQQAAQRFQSYDLVLIDTVGRSQRDEDQIAALQQLISALPGCECHLVLSATTRLPDLEDVIDRFSSLRPATVVVTKLDETTCPVNVFNASRLSGRPLSFLTTGQRVPEDIEVADALNLARAIVEELG